MQPAPQRLPRPRSRHRARRHRHRHPAHPPGGGRRGHRQRYLPRLPPLLRPGHGAPPGRHLSQRRLRRAASRGLPQGRLGGAQSGASAGRIHHGEFRFPAALPAEGQCGGAAARRVRRQRLRHHRASRADDPAIGRGAHRETFMMQDPERPEGLAPQEPWDALYFPPPPERDPFWDYGDLLIFAGLTLPCLLLGLGVVKAAFWIFQLHPAVKTWEMLAAQFVFYALLSAVLAALFRVQYDRPFWRSLGWVAPRLSPFSVVASGVGLALAVMLLGVLIRTPHIESPLTELLKDPTSLVLVAIFGSIVAPVCEELLFRGFLQPLLVRSLGAVAGIVATALPF